MKTLVNFMENYKRGHGENANTPLQLFIRAPKRRQDPQYYEKVSDPIDMMKIKLKLNTEEYSGMAELKADFEKLFANAILYYAEGTEHHVAATELKALFSKAYGEFLNIRITGLKYIPEQTPGSSLVSSIIMT